MSDLPATDVKKYPVTWVFGLLNGEECFFGFCGKEKKLFHIAQNTLVVAGIQNLFAGEKECEESRGCLNQECPLNTTTPASYWTRHGLQGKPPKQIRSNLCGVELPKDVKPVGGVVFSREPENGPYMEVTTIGIEEKGEIQSATS